MENLKELLFTELIEINKKSDSVDDFFKESSKILLENGYVKDSFLEAVSSREKVYPTGLAFENINVALPHTFAEHIEKPFIFVNKMADNNLKFIHMGTDDVEVYPEYILILGIKNPEEQVGLLAKLMDIFGNDELAEQLKVADDKDKILDILGK